MLVGGEQLLRALILAFIALFLLLYALLAFILLSLFSLSVLLTGLYFSPQILPFFPGSLFHPTEREQRVRGMWFGNSCAAYSCLLG